MALSSKRKLGMLLLLFYWPAFFVLAHVPIPQALRGIQVSDKMLHYLAYFVLVFLFWFAVSPDKKVDWRRAPVWWILFVVVWYGVLDEWLQSYVGRSADVKDFVADLTGAVTGLILLTLVAFWLACLVVTGTVIFVFTNFVQANLSAVLPVTNTMFYLLSYAFFTVLWLRYIYHFLPVRPPEGRWLAGALALPVGFLLIVEVFSVVVGQGFEPLRVIVAASGAAIVVAVIFVKALLHHKAA